jgi:homogentisate 1,2-dioxygenase
VPHGPDVDAFEKASNADLKPVKLENTLPFMFETRFLQRVTQYAAETPALQKDYADYGQKLKKRFSSPATKS